MEHTHIAKDGTVYTHTHEEAHEHGHSHSHPHHHKNTKAVLNRMNRAIGHMEAVKTMIEDGRDCKCLFRLQRCVPPSTISVKSFWKITLTTVW